MQLDSQTGTLGFGIYIAGKHNKFSLLAMSLLFGKLALMLFVYYLKRSSYILNTLQVIEKQKNEYQKQTLGWKIYLTEARNEKS